MMQSPTRPNACGLRIIIFLVLLLIVLYVDYNGNYSFSSSSSSEKSSEGTKETTISHPPETINQNNNINNNNVEKKKEIFSLTQQQEKLSSSSTSSSSSSSSLDPSLVGGSAAILLQRYDAISPSTSGNDDNDEKNIQQQQKIILAKTNSVLPECPKNFKLHINETTSSKKDIVQDRQASFVLWKYKYYAKLCKQRNGVMWSKLSKQTHDLIATKVANVFEASLSSKNSDDHSTRRNSFRQLDIGSGCGIGVGFFQQYFSSKKNYQYYGLGIDIIEAAVKYAKENMISKSIQDSGHVRICQADMTQLRDWIAPQTFDAVSAFGALLHTPREKICSTVNELLRVVKNDNGVIVASYFDNHETADMFAKCNVDFDFAFASSSSTSSKEKKPNRNEYRVEVTVVEEKIWFKGLGIPKANMKLNPRSIIWRKIKRV